MSYIVRMNTDGTILIPKELRDELELESGTFICLDVYEDKIILRKKSKESFSKEIENEKNELQKNYEWLCKNPEINKQYPGEYIAIVSQKIVAHDKDFKEMMKEALKYDAEPLVDFIEQPRTII